MDLWNVSDESIRKAAEAKSGKRVQTHGRIYRTSGLYVSVPMEDGSRLLVSRLDTDTIQERRAINPAHVAP